MRSGYHIKISSTETSKHGKHIPYVQESITMRPFEFFSSLSVVYLALALPNVRRAAPNPNAFEASKTVESAIPNLLNHAQQSIKKGQHGVASFHIDGASGKAEIFDDIPVPLFRFDAH
jgi:hypothetical protein